MIAGIGPLSRRQVLLRGGVAGAGTLGAALLAACGDDDKSDASQSSGGRKTDLTFYSVANAVPNDPFWSVYTKGLNDASEAFGVQIKNLAPEKFSVQAIVDLMESAVAARPDGIMAMVVEPEPMEGPINRALDLNIPVIAVNVNDPRPVDERIEYLFYVGGNEELSGRISAERQLQVRTPRRAAVANHAPGHIGLEYRTKGYSDVMKDAGVSVDKLAISQASATQSAEVLRGYFTSHRDTDALFTLGPPGATPAFQVLREEGLIDKVIHSGFDISKEQVQAIQNDELLSTIGQQQYLQGYLPPLMLQLNKQHGFTLAGDVQTGPFLIDKANVANVVEQVDDQFM